MSVVLFIKYLRFAINPSQTVMNPTDSSVTSVGSQTLSSLDISKLQCLYNCDGTSSGTCGGHVSGDSGVVESSGAKTCKWLLAVADGFAIEMSFESFDVSVTVSVYQLSTINYNISPLHILRSLTAVPEV